MSDAIADLLGAIPNPILMLDQEACIAHANLHATEMFGHDPTGLSALTYLRQATILTAIDAAVREKRDTTAKFFLAGRGSERTFDVHCHPTQTGALLTFLDSSEQDRSAQIRRDFIANISHELRTPLTSLTGSMVLIGVWHGSWYM